ncbi:MAG: 6-phosphofructokinase [Oscillospiraceae bacterium]|jgi:6-phosphofructokinase 1|nr:6-phosphofructokinase [Oscillospiraceae bacterium]
MSDNLTGACVFAQSGGPTAVINASAYGVIRAASQAPEITRVLGARNGILGVLAGEFIDVDREDPRELALLPNTPSSEFGSCRHKLKAPEDDERDYIQILEVFRRFNVRYFFYNGGNDSMDTCEKVSRFFAKNAYECRVIGIPKTIDNDLFGTDHSPGYGSAAKYIATSVAEICLDNRVYDTPSVTVVEMMGRHAGWLTGAAALAGFTGAGPDLIYLPEVVFDMDRFVRDVRAVYDARQKCLVAVSEGLVYADGTFVSEAAVSASDGFAHAQLGGLAALLQGIIKQRLGAKTRGIELSLLQRCASHLASRTDVDEAVAVGEFAVRQAVLGATGKLASLKRSPGGAYACELTLEPLSVAANREKKVPRAWINADGNYVTDEFIDYALPLIQGDPPRRTENGVPRFARLHKYAAAAIDN